MRCLSATDLLVATGEAVGVAAPGDVVQLLKPALRRAAYVLAPSARADLIRFVVEPLAPFGELREATEAALDDLIIYGDILEMRRLSQEDWGAPAEVLRPAPPTFVRRANGDVMILGVAGDHSSALTPDLETQLRDDGPVRRLEAKGDTGLPAHLKLLGFAQLSEQAWLRTPNQESAAAYLAHWRATLDAAPALTNMVDDLEILDSARDPRFYAGRWRAPDSKDGVFVARRPQLYGARLWSLVEMQGGRPHRLIDLFADDDRQRPCDFAWRIQAALDSLRGTPQRLRVRRSASTAWIDIFSPLPAFAERRLALVGGKIAGSKCLYSYEIPTDHLVAETSALGSMMWMTVDKDIA